MSYQKRHSQFFRIIFATIVAILLIVVIRSLYFKASTPDDENLFRTTPGSVLVTEPITGRPAPDDSDDPDESISVETMILPGEVIRSVDGELFRQLSTLEAYLTGLDSLDELNFEVFDPRDASTRNILIYYGDLPANGFRGLPSSVYVITVFEDGASDRAGLRVGDLIVSINEQFFKNMHDADRILKEARSDKKIAYQVIRGNEDITFDIVLATVGLHLPVLLFFFCGLFMMLTGAFIGLARPQFRAARYLGVGFIVTGFFIAFLEATRTIKDEFIEVRAFVLVAAILFSLPLWLHTAHYFPLKHQTMLDRRWIRTTGYVIAAVGVLAILIIDEAFFGFFLLALILYNAIVQFMYRKKASPEYSEISKVLKRFNILAVSGIALTLGFIIYTHWGTFDVGGNKFGYIGIPLLLYPLSTLFVIGRYNLIDLDLRVKRNIQYSAFSTMLGVLAVLALGWILMNLPQMELPLPNIQFQGSFIEISDEPMLGKNRQTMEKGVLMFLAILLSFLIVKARRKGQAFIDKKFFRGSYDYRLASRELAEVMSSELNMKGLAEGIVQKLTQLMKVKQAGILFYRNESECSASESAGLSADRWHSFASGIQNSFTDVLKSDAEELHFSVEYLPTSLREHFSEHGFRHIIAIRSKDKFVGTLLIGEKLSESPFHNEDLLFLTSISKQASVSIENSFLYDELAERERMKHELAIARRIQLASLPQHTPVVAGLDVAGISVPALEVGGDYFDYLNGNPDDLTIIVGDVSGKGTSAALYMSKVQGIMRSLYDFGLSPRDLFIRANQLLIDSIEKQSFITALGVSINPSTRQLRLARAGHAPLYHYQSKSKRVEEWLPKGIGMGLANSEKFAVEIEETTLSFDEGDIFLLITDGITEAQSDGGEEYGEEGLEAILAEANGASAKKIRDSIVASVNQFTGDMPQHDDLTIVVVKAV